MPRNGGSPHRRALRECQPVLEWGAAFHQRQILFQSFRQACVMALASPTSETTAAVGTCAPKTHARVNKMSLASKMSTGMPHPLVSSLEPVGLASEHQYHYKHCCQHLEAAADGQLCLVLS